MENKYNMKSPGNVPWLLFYLCILLGNCYILVFTNVDIFPFKAVKRLMREAQELSQPTAEYFAQPVEDNLFEWHFSVRGPADSDFEGGVYHGRISLPPEYPLKPPSIMLLTVCLVHFINIKQSNNWFTIFNSPMEDLKSIAKYALVYLVTILNLGFLLGP